MSDLQKLIDAVEAENDFGLRGEAFDLWGSRAYAMHLTDAYDGDLNAARRLHEALLPGWKWDVTLHAASVEVPGHKPNPHFPLDGIYSGSCDNPARAWLLAILRALQAKEAAPQSPEP